MPGIHRVTYGVALLLLVLELDATYRGSASTMFLVQRVQIAGSAVAVFLLCFSSWLSMRESPSRLERGQARVFLTGLAILLVATLGGTLIDMPGGPYNDPRRALIHDDMKMIVSNDSRFELYDLASDEAERKNLWDDAALRKPMEERYAAIRAGLKEIRVTGARKQ